ncbi:MAG: HlyD family type I secretion periplasmic adaptor subunit, partial [Alphaproteobacteria bacterium]
MSARDDAEFMREMDAAVRQSARPAAHVLLFVMLLFVAVGLIWASEATLEEVTRGDAKVIPSSQVQVVQNLEGGILAEMLVREGAVVNQDEVLLRIDNNTVASEYRE